MINSALEEKLNNLKEEIERMEKVVVAFSGGVDSSFLAYYVRKVLGKNMKAVMFTTKLQTAKEIQEAFEFAHKFEVPLETISIDVINTEIFRSNPKNRCYHCKHLLFSNAVEFAQKENLQYIVDGSNLDDLGDYRPGVKALKELNVKSPLQKANLTKQDIRDLSEHFSLPTFKKEAMACLATRIPYGDEVSCIKLEMVELAEEYLRSLGYTRVRARHYHHTVKIEVDHTQVTKLKQHINEVEVKMNEIGFDEVVVDDTGYEMGKMNKQD